MQLYTELETDRLILKTLSEDDFDRMYTLQSNPEVMRFIGMGKARTKDEAREIFEKFLNHQKKWGFSFCSAYEKVSGDLIGFVGVIHLALDDNSPEIEVGYWLLPEFWNKGYATEGTKACIEWAFNHLSIDKIVGVTHPDNLASQHVLEKSGLKFIQMSEYRGKKVKRFEINRS